MSADGPLRFARFAYPPHEMGYCGPDGARALLEYATAGVADGGLREMARGFAGAWPYLELIAHANGIADPLDAAVVEAYWLGNRLLDTVRPTLLGDSMEERFRGPAGRGWEHLAEVLEQAPRPHHGFHVFVVYPWVGLLRSGATDQALRVLDRCRVRWGRVVERRGDHAVVESRPLVWDGRALGLGAPTPETVTAASYGYRLTTVCAGDVVALHWDWVCERLDARRLDVLRRETRAVLDLVNRRLAFPPAANVLA